MAWVRARPSEVLWLHASDHHAQTSSAQNERTLERRGIANALKVNQGIDIYVNGQVNKTSETSGLSILNMDCVMMVTLCAARRTGPPSKANM